MTIVVSIVPSSTNTFLAAINRILRITTVMQWDDDDITSFSQTQHAATISLARQSVQHVINDLLADNFVFPEQATSHIATTAGTRLYSLESNFVRFEDDDPAFFELTGAIGTDASGILVQEYDESILKKQIPAYTSQAGNPLWYYFTNDNEIGFYPVPDASKVYRYDYQKNVMPESENDILPFHSMQMSYAFVDMAARVFTFLFTTQPVDGLENDIVYKRAKAALMSLNAKMNPQKKYGFRYQ